MSHEAKPFRSPLTRLVESEARIFGRFATVREHIDVALQWCNLAVALNPLSRWGRAVRVTVLTLLVALPAHARTSDGTFEVPTRCGTRDQFEASIRSRVGEAEANAILASLSLSIREHSAAYTLTMQVGSEIRQLQDEDCSELFRAAVVVAIALWEAPARSTTPLDEPEVFAQPGPTGGAPMSSEHARPLPADGRMVGPWGQVQATPAAARPRRLRLLLGAELGAAVGLQPSLAVVGGIRAGFELGRFGLHASWRWLPKSGDRDENDRGVEVTAMGARMAGSYRVADAIAIEAGISAYSLRGTGLGSNQIASANLWAVGPVLGLWATAVQLGSAFLAIGAEGQLALVRPRFEITDYGEVFRVAPVHGATFLVAGYRFE